MKGLRHIGIAVKSLDEGLGIYRDLLGLSVIGIEELPDRGLRTAFLDGGGVQIELLESLREGSVIDTFLKKKGPGIHHLAFEVGDLPGHLERLQSLGVTLVDSCPRPGAQGTVVAFLHPRSTHGVLVELVQRTGGPDHSGR